MKSYTTKGVYGEKKSYALETLDDWKEYEALLVSENLMKFNPNFYEFKRDFIRNIGKKVANGGEIYEIVGVEDNNSMLDWYYICQNINNKQDVKYYLMDDTELELHLINA